MRTLQKTLLAIVIAANTYTSANPYTVVINPDKDSIVFVNKLPNQGGSGEVPLPEENEDHSITSFNASSTNIALGSSITLSWDVKNSQSLNISNVGNDLNHNSSITLQPTVNTVYVLTSVGIDGKTLQKTINVSVVAAAEIVSFTANSNFVSKGDPVTLFFVIKNAASATLNGVAVNVSDTKRKIIQNTIGDINYVLEVKDSLGNKTTKTQKITVSDMNMINSFGVNTPIVSNINTALIFTWNMATPVTLTLKNNLGLSIPLTPTLKTYTYSKIHTIGEAEYTLEATNTAGETFSKSLTVETVAVPEITSFDFPSPIFVNQSYTINFTGNNVDRFGLRGTSQIGIPTSTAVYESGTNFSSATSVGTYSIFLTAYNKANAATSLTKQIVVEASPTATIAIINNVRYQNTVAPNTALTFGVFSKSAGSTLVRKASNSSSAAVIDLPSNAPSVVGTYLYYLSACKTVNNEARCSIPVTATLVVK